MDNREKRRLLFEETMQVCMTDESLRAAMALSVQRQQIIWQEDGEPLWTPRYDRPAERVVSRKRSFEAARFYAQSGKKVCVLNFASSVSPGGGVTTGAQAQEESLCRVSTLYPALSHECARPFYDRHWQMIRAGTMKRENRDDCIYTPGITVVRDDAAGEPLLAPAMRYTADVITCAAPELRPVDDGSRYAPTRDELFLLLTKRWRRILAAAAANGAEVLILGAFGCGVFANPPEVTAAAFDQAAQAIDHCFETIEFPVFTANADPSLLRAFSVLGSGKAE